MRKKESLRSTHKQASLAKQPGLGGPSLLCVTRVTLFKTPSQQVNLIYVPHLTFKDKMNFNYTQWLVLKEKQKIERRTKATESEPYAFL